jgi:hypothetical protein
MLPNSCLPIWCRSTPTSDADNCSGTQQHRRDKRRELYTFNNGSDTATSNNNTHSVTAKERRPQALGYASPIASIRNGERGIVHLFCSSVLFRPFCSVRFIISAVWFPLHSILPSESPGLGHDGNPSAGVGGWFCAQLTAHCENRMQPRVAIKVPSFLP